MEKNCGNCANYDRTKMAHTDMCGRCVRAHTPDVYKEPSQWRRKPQTNGDRIRAMTDEMLADLIFKYNIDDHIPFCKERLECVQAIESENFDPYGSECRKCLMQWLKQPAEDNKNENT